MSLMPVAASAPAAPVRLRVEAREDALSPYAVRSRGSRREVPEEPCPIRGEFQRDRDRIIHSKSFRRLKHKTQVFIAPTGDHYVTRLTHTLEVAQIARTISRALDLNEDLTEAIALGHDLGHTPFGHVGESEVDRLHDEGYRHADQSLRVVERLEKEGRGLNLTEHVRQGIALHSKPPGDFFGNRVPAGLSLEGQVCRLSDAVAYLNHDLADAFRAGLLEDEDLPPQAAEVLGSRHSERIHTMVTDVIETSWAASGEEGFDPGWRPVIEMSPPVREALNTLRGFMFERVYMVEDAGEESDAARRIVALLYRYLDDSREVVPPEYGSGDRAVVDYLAGMTDHYAIRMAERIEPGIAGPLMRKAGIAA
jgi:dGTPase